MAVLEETKVEKKPQGKRNARGRQAVNEKNEKRRAKEDGRRTLEAETVVQTATDRSRSVAGKLELGKKTEHLARALVRRSKARCHYQKKQYPRASPTVTPAALKLPAVAKAATKVGLAEVEESLPIQKDLARRVRDPGRNRAAVQEAQAPDLVHDLPHPGPDPDRDRLRAPDPEAVPDPRVVRNQRAVLLPKRDRAPRRAALAPGLHPDRSHGLGRDRVRGKADPGLGPGAARERADHRPGRGRARGRADRDPGRRAALGKLPGRGPGAARDLARKDGNHGARVVRSRSRSPFPAQKAEAGRGPAPLRRAVPAVAVQADPRDQPHRSRGSPFPEVRSVRATLVRTEGAVVTVNERYVRIRIIANTELIPLDAVIHLLFIRKKFAYDANIVHPVCSRASRVQGRAV